MFHHKKAFNITEFEVVGSGLYGTYFNLGNGKGIKVIGLNVEANEECGFKSYNDLYESHFWEEALHELRLLKKAKKRVAFVPIGFKVIPVIYKKKIYPGIIMQHIKGTLLEDVKKVNKKKIKRYIRQRLYSKKIFHHDIHNWNIILSGNKYYILDFSPDCVNIE